MPSIRSLLSPLARAAVAAAGLVAMLFSAQASADLVAFSSLPALQLPAPDAVPDGLDALVLSFANTVPEPGALGLAVLACAAAALSWRWRAEDAESGDQPAVSSAMARL